MRLVVTLEPVSSDDQHVTSVAFDRARFDAVVAGARSGDSHALEELFRELQPRLLRFLRSMEDRAADDLAADVWLAVASGISRFEGNWADFRAWVFAIGRKRLADHRRTAARRRTDSVDSAVFARQHAEDAPEDETVDKISGQQAASLIASVLRDEQAEVLLLRVLADLDVDQVASILQRSPNWVRVTQHRAVANLAKRLGSKIVVIR